MLWRTSKLTDYRIEATDGTVGGIADRPVSRQMEEAPFRHCGRDPCRAAMPETALAPGLAPPAGCEDDAEAIRAVEDNPRFDPENPVERACERRLHRHYQKPVYWI